MKKLLLILTIFFSLSAYSQGNTQIKFNLPNDPVTLNKVKVMLTGVSFDQYGKVLSVSYIIKLTNPITDADIPVTSEIQDAGFFSKEKTFTLNGKAILSTTRVYSPLTTAQGVPIPNAILISDYLQLKNLNAYRNPNATLIGGGDPAWKFIQAVLNEIILIKQTNGELPI